MRRLYCNPEIEVQGTSVLSIVDNVRSDHIRLYLEKHQFTDIQPDTWYPCQTWLDIMNDMAQSPNTSPNYVAIGMAIADKVVLPPELHSASLPQILEMWDAIYQMNHRGGDVGYVRTEKIHDSLYRTVHKHLYPDDLTYGLAYGWCRRFLPQGTHFTVRYEDLHYRLDDGNATETVILCEWQ